MNNEKEQIVSIISDCFEEERNRMEILYEKTKEDNALINHVLRARFLLKTAASQDNIFGTERTGLIPVEFIKGSIQLALLVSAIETIGTPSKYRSFNEWLNTEFFMEKERKYSRR